jgi:hypothetical protein
MKVKCSKCNSFKFCRPDRYEMLKEKFGSVEKLIKEYICLDCRTEILGTEDPPKLQAE